MTQSTWDAVDQYLVGTLSPADPILEAALANSAAAGLPPIQVAPNQGKLLMLAAKAIRAERILEIGTLGGYSTIWLARALPAGGRVVTLEFEPKHAEVAKANLARAGFAEMVDVRVGRAIDLLPGVLAQGLGPFDLVFIDADKQSSPEYFAWALRLTRVGGLIVLDNVVREGEVTDGQSTDPRVLGIRKALEVMGSEPRVMASAIQTVGGKGYDGFAIALVVS